MLTGNTILVVEDDAAMREMLVMMLEDEGVVAVAACDGEDAMDVLEHRRFGAVLSDVRMPRMGGLDLLARVRHTWPDSKFIVMTAFGSQEDAQRAQSAGAFALLPKPFSRAELLAVLERALA